MSRIGRVAVMIVALTAAPIALPAQQFAYTGSLQFTTGNYVFSTRTNSVALYTGLEAIGGGIHVGATIPVIAQNSPWVSYTGTGMLASGGPESSTMGSMTRAGGMMGPGGRMSGGAPVVLPDTVHYDQLGVGDPVISLSLDVVPWTGRGAALRLTGKAKAPVADPVQGFGTGAWDYGGGASIATASGRTFLFADAFYWVLGDLPGLELRNVVAYAASVGRPLSRAGRWTAMAGVSGATAALEGVAAPLMINGGVNRLIGARHSIGALASVGLTEAAPDVAIGMSWSLTW